MKGMQKIKRGKGFINILNYAFENRNGQKPGRLIGGNMTFAKPRDLAKEFEQSISKRKEIEKPVWHNSLRLPEGEKITDEKWETIANDYMKKMGFSSLHQRAYIIHDDDDGQHIHIIASRVSLANNLYLGKNENLKSTKHIAQLEIKYDLTITKNTDDDDDPLKIKRRPPTPGERGEAIRTGKAPPRLMLQAIIDQAVADKPGFSDFVDRLSAHGVSIKPSGETGAAQGITFEIRGQFFTGSSLGTKSYGWKALQARIDYDVDRDQALLDRLRLRAKEAKKEEKGKLVPMGTEPPEPRRKYRRTLELVLEKNETPDLAEIIYKWKNRDYVALIDKGDHISLMSNADSIIRASLQLSRDKGWVSVKAMGNEEFKRKSWLIGSEIGIEIQGYTPTFEDIEELDLIIKNKQRAKENGKNRRHVSESSNASVRADSGDRADESDYRAERIDFEFEFDNKEDPDSAATLDFDFEEINMEDDGDRNSKTISNAVAAVLDAQIHDPARSSSAHRDERSGSSEPNKREPERPSTAEQGETLIAERLARIGSKDGGVVDIAYKKEVRKIIESAEKSGTKAEDLNWQKIDYFVAKELLKTGYRQNLVEKAISDLSLAKLAIGDKSTEYAARAAGEASSHVDFVAKAEEDGSARLG